MTSGSAPPRYTKEGRFMFAVLAAAAEYELELRAERQAEGIAAAKRRQESGQMLAGKKHIGRPRAVGPAEEATLRRLVDEGVSVTEAARILKISRSTAYATLAKPDQPSKLIGAERGGRTPRLSAGGEASEVS
ncbi:helix-turn-helix domain-containing protein [Nonomuraea sp. NPDC050691]|uniref:helix-turn-helix domain-containing protein n=1 Tax=Nonomuraea sp. NPDC050691 TaxID=3155661 RepID=UPI0033E4CD4B